MVNSYLTADKAAKGSWWQSQGSVRANPFFTPLSLGVVDSSGRPVMTGLDAHSDYWVQLEAEIDDLHPALTIGYALFTEDGTLLYWTPAHRRGRRSAYSTAQGTQLPSQPASQGHPQRGDLPTGADGQPSLHPMALRAQHGRSHGLPGDAGRSFRFTHVARTTAGPAGPPDRVDERVTKPLLGKAAAQGDDPGQAAGGLSNQMFQYAAARRLAHRHATELLLDTSWYADLPGGATPRAFELDNFRIQASRATADDLIGTDGVRRARLRDLPVAALAQGSPAVPVRGGARASLRREHSLPPRQRLPLRTTGSRRSISRHIAPLIREEFTPRNPPGSENARLLQVIESTPSVSLHVRRGRLRHKSRHRIASTGRARCSTMPAPSTTSPNASLTRASSSSRTTLNGSKGICPLPSGRWSSSDTTRARARTRTSAS